MGWGGLRLESRCLGSHWLQGRGRERSERGSSQGQETSSPGELRERREWEAGESRTLEHKGTLRAQCPQLPALGSDTTGGGFLGGTPRAKATGSNDLDPPWMLRSTIKPLSALLDNPTAVEGSRPQASKGL